MSCAGGSSIWPMARRVVCLLGVGFLVALALQQGVTNFTKQGSTTVDSDSSNASSPPSPLPHHQMNFEVPQLQGRTMGPKNFDTFGDTKREVPHGPDPIHNRRASKSGETPGRQ